MMGDFATDRDGREISSIWAATRRGPAPAGVNTAILDFAPAYKVRRDGTVLMIESGQKLKPNAKGVVGITRRDGSRTTTTVARLLAWAFAERPSGMDEYGSKWWTAVVLDKDKPLIAANVAWHRAGDTKAGLLKGAPRVCAIVWAMASHEEADWPKIARIFGVEMDDLALLKSSCAGRFASLREAASHNKASFGSAFIPPPRYAKVVLWTLGEGES